MSKSSSDAMANASQEDFQTALFLDMVAQQTNMALIFLGRIPHPESGERVQDLEAARLFIDQLEMLEAKTKGNLNKREESLLKQSLTTTRLAFVEAVEHPQEKAGEPEASRTSSPANEQSSSSAAAGASAGSEATQPAAEGSSAADAGARKKFVKKY